MILALYFDYDKVLYICFMTWDYITSQCIAPYISYTLFSLLARHPGPSIDRQSLPSLKRRARRGIRKAVRRNWTGGLACLLRRMGPEAQAVSKSLGPHPNCFGYFWGWAKLSLTYKPYPYTAWRWWVYTSIFRYVNCFGDLGITVW